MAFCSPSYTFHFSLYFLFSNSSLYTPLFGVFQFSSALFLSCELVPFCMLPVSVNLCVRSADNSGTGRKKNCNCGGQKAETSGSPNIQQVGIHPSIVLVQDIPFTPLPSAAVIPCKSRAVSCCAREFLWQLLWPKAQKSSLVEE